MATDPVLRIGYAGSLAAWSPEMEQLTFLQKLKRFFGTYLPNNVNSATRSGYFLFRGLKKLKEKYPSEAQQLRVELWGSIAAGNAEQVKRWNLGDIVTIGGYLPKQESVQKLGGCDILFLPLESEKNGQRPLMIPGKLFEMLNLEKPILALIDESDCSHILARAGNGIVCSPHDDERLADLLAEIIRNRHSLKEKYAVDRAYVNEFDFRNITARLAGCFDRVMKQNA